MKCWAVTAGEARGTAWLAESRQTTQKGARTSGLAVYPAANQRKDDELQGGMYQVHVERALPRALGHRRWTPRHRYQGLDDAEPPTDRPPLYVLELMMNGLPQIH